MQQKLIDTYLEKSKELSMCYQPLFDLMREEHGVILSLSELDEIILQSKKVEKLINEL
jgi:hypothetical protein